MYVYGDDDLATDCIEQTKHNHLVSPVAADSLASTTWRDTFRTMAQDPCSEDHSYLSLTVARYDKEDPIGKYVALLTLSPIYLSVSYMTLVLVRRDLQTFILACGHLVDLAINKVLKIWFAEARPEGCVNTGHGMPSNHTQYMFFFASYASLFLWGRVSMRAENKSGLMLIFALWATAVGLSRIHLRCHTFKQVAAGALVGSCTGSLWYLFYSNILRPICPTVARWPISRALLVRDYSQVPNVLAFEYANLNIMNNGRVDGNTARAPISRKSR